MRGVNVASAALGLMIGVLAAAPASAWNQGNVQVLTVLPDLVGQGPGQPVKSSAEGLTVGPDGNIYVTTFGFNTTGGTTGPANLIVISPNGKIVNQVPITCTNCVTFHAPHPVQPSPHMLGLRFNPITHALWVLDFGGGFVLSVPTDTGIASMLANFGAPIPTTPPPERSGLNALTFDAQGNGYVSDSFQGIIWQIPPHGTGGGPATVWKADPLLGPGTGLTPPFGANGVEFSPPGCAPGGAGGFPSCKALFVANTAYHQIIQIAVNSDGSVGAATPFITGINAPDGIAFDSNGNMWICANQEDEIVVINNTGKVIAKLGNFDGIDPKGIVSGLLFPASLAFSPDGQWLYVTNLTLYLPYASALPAIDSAWTLQVNGYTVSRLPAKIPPISGN
jgi:sugar lactone lactonase YvrE